MKAKQKADQGVITLCEMVFIHLETDLSTSNPQRDQVSQREPFISGTLSLHQ